MAKKKKEEVTEEAVVEASQENAEVTVKFLMSYGCCDKQGDEKTMPDNDRLKILVNAGIVEII